MYLLHSLSPVVSSAPPFLHLFLVCNRYGQHRKKEKEKPHFGNKESREGGSVAGAKHNLAGITAAAATANGRTDDGLTSLALVFPRIYTSLPLPALLVHVYPILLARSTVSYIFVS